MPTVHRLLLPSLLLSVALLPRSGLAQGYPWCSPGVAQALPPAGSTDTTSKIIRFVCTQSGFERCCSQRWSASCIQRASDYATDQGYGDVCGRNAWVMGPVGKTQVRYPRDFSLVTLGDAKTPGDATMLTDAEGPLAVQGTVQTSGFNINWGTRGPVGVVAGTLKLSSGTVHGSVTYSNQNNNGSGVDCPTPVKDSPINFGTASTALLAMSQALTKYTANGGTVRIKNGRLAFTGNDPELNVFTAYASELVNVRNYDFTVPVGAKIIINVLGNNPYIRWASFNRNNAIMPSMILFNFPDATSLQAESVFITGSILAPKATVDLHWGQVGGTTVVKKASANIELHWAKFQFPGSCGCLSRDPTWSCSYDTCLNDTGEVATLGPEAGFFQLNGGSYTSEGDATRVSPDHRVFYTFQPASNSPETKPVAVFFNGGPGYATSSLLFAFNTAARTLDPARASDAQQVVSNPDSWTSFANILYVDAPGTGFSYPMALDDGSTPTVGIDLDREAGFVLRAIVRFLDRHPAIRKNKVVLVGESYGGTRATLILDHLLTYQTLLTGPSYKDENLYNDLLTHFAFLFPSSDPKKLSASQVASQFGHQVLIQPVVLGSKQWDPQANYRDASGCRNQTWPDGTADLFECNQASGWSDNGLTTVSTRLTTVETLRTMLGVDPLGIRWMYKSERARAYGRPPFGDDGGMWGAFGGQLDTSKDCYFLYRNTTAGAHFSGTSRWWDDPAIGVSFVRNLGYVKTFITRAMLDMQVITKSIPYAIADSYYASYVESMTYDEANRPGWIDVTLKPSYGTGVKNIRFPTYAGAGHSIEISQSQQLLADVVEWYSTNASFMMLGDVPSSELPAGQQIAPSGIVSPGPLPELLP
jgi:choice-of-anchor A domain-containing protein